MKRAAGTVRRLMDTARSGQGARSSFRVAAVTPSRITQITPIDVVFAVPQDRVPAVREAQQAHARAGGGGGYVGTRG